MDFRPTEEQELLRRTVREFAETEIRPHVMRVGRGAAFSDRADAEARGARPAGHPVRRAVRRRRRCRRSTTASASRSWRASIRRSRCRSRRTTACAPSHIVMFGTDAQKQQLPAAAGARREARRLGPDRVDVRQRRRGMRTTATRAGDGWVLNGSKTFITHGAHRRRDGGDGGHRSRRRPQGHLRVHRRARARRA